MCRLFGAIKLKGFDSKNDVRLLNIIHKMAVEAERGNNDDATGFMTFLDKKLTVIKSPTPATEFMQTKGVTSFFKDIGKMNFICGHTRYATSGSTKDNANNHPVVDYQKGVGITHNGVILNHKDLASKENIKLRFDVDTEILLRMFIKHKSIKDTVKKIEGTYSFVALDTKNQNQVNIFRHNSRTLHMAYFPKMRILLYATDDDIIKNSIEECVLNIFEKPVEDFYMTKLAEDHHYTINIDEDDESLIQLVKLDVPAIRTTPTYNSNRYPANRRSSGSHKKDASGKIIDSMLNPSSASSKTIPIALYDYAGNSAIRNFVDYEGIYLRQTGVLDTGELIFKCSLSFRDYIQKKAGEWTDLIDMKSFKESKKGDMRSKVTIKIKAKAGGKKDRHNKLAKLLMQHDKIFFDQVQIRTEYQKKYGEPESPLEQYTNTLTEKERIPYVG